MTRTQQRPSIPIRRPLSFHQGSPQGSGGWKGLRSCGAGSIVCRVFGTFVPSVAHGAVWDDWWSVPPFASPSPGLEA